MSSNECADCIPQVPVDSSVDVKKQAQPASASEMAKVPVPSTLPGPSSHHSDSQSDPANGNNAVQGQSSAEEEIRPPSSVYPNLIIEFCDRCRWAPRATWIQTELFLTFPTPAIQSIALIPLNTPETGGRFRVWLDKGEGGSELLWDRKTEGGFPELKVLKQRLRNHIQPEMSLGHSDKPGTKVIQQ